ncbi:hypothetical protein OH723_31830 (plasmid) [Streptomyces albidoflavus]|uniref:hypothetical protein n=1 Tax=Streptomyces TaxID=1883 RepID=UPI001BE95161|nr:hypothetical protein [Streptomyces sp. McG6]WTC39956.1 hypothetical protein OH723_31830 [Streptomyces albidoflavus]
MASAPSWCVSATARTVHAAPLRLKDKSVRTCGDAPTPQRLRAASVQSARTRGGALRLTVDTRGRRCVCGTQYGREELLGLPLAERWRMAA